MNNSDRFSRVRSTENGLRYLHNNASVKVNPDGLPVAFRRVACYGQPGSFAVDDRYQVITPKGITAVTPDRSLELRAECFPLN
jgi:hypothetical protein